MRWQTKGRLQKACSVLPGGRQLNYLLQRYVARSFPRPPQIPPDGPLDERFAGRMDLSVGDGWFVLAQPPT